MGGLGRIFQDQCAMLPLTINNKDDDKLVILGARFSSPRVAKEADRAAGLLSHYREVLTAYGLDDRFAAQFDDLRKRHQELIAQRTQGIVAKQNTIAHYNNTLHLAWTWVEQVHAILKPFARRNQNWSVQLNKAIPDTESELTSAIAQLRQLLEETKSQISSQVQVDELITASHEIEQQTHNVIGTKLQAKNQARDETRGLDRLDGELSDPCRGFKYTHKFASFLLRFKKCFLAFSNAFSHWITAFSVSKNAFSHFQKLSRIG